MNNKTSNPFIDEVGTPQSERVVWTDEKAPFFGRRLDTSSGNEVS